MAVARVAVGRLALSVRTFCIWRLTIMKDASRKNMMSISGMISSRVSSCGKGERIFMGYGAGTFAFTAANREGDLLDASTADRL